MHSTAPRRQSQLLLLPGYKRGTRLPHECGRGSAVGRGNEARASGCRGFSASAHAPPLAEVGHALTSFFLNFCKIMSQSQACALPLP